MSIYDGVVERLLKKAPLSSSAARSMMLVRRMRDHRIRAHVVGCCLLSKKAGPELLVYTDSPLWAQEFQMNSPAFLAEWNYLCECEHVDMSAHTVKFQVSSRVHASDDGDPSHADTYAREVFDPLSPQEIEAVEREVSVISDKKLRESARSAMTSILRWKKSNDDSKAD